MTAITSAQSRKPGRPRKLTPDEVARPLLSREAVVDAAYALCDTIRLADLTLIDVANSLAVSTTTVRHHIKTRQNLTKLLVDRHFKQLRECLPPLSGNWAEDLDNFLHVHTSANSSKQGFAAYFFEHRFEPEIDPFGTEDGIFVASRMLHILRTAGLGPNEAALAWLTTMHLVLSIGYAQSRGQTPADRTAVFARIGLAAPKDPDDRSVIAAMGRVDLQMIYAILSSLLKYAIGVGFDFSAAQPAREEPGMPANRRPS